MFQLYYMKIARFYQQNRVILQYRLAIFRYLRKYMTVLFIRDIIVDEEK